MSSLAFSAPLRAPYKGATPPRPQYGDEEKTDASALRDWQLRQISHDHRYRIRLSSTWRRADLFKQNYQWLQKSYNMDSTTQHWAQVTYSRDDDDAIPTPVFNEFAPPLDNEAARMAKPDYEPYSRVDENADLKLRTAAVLAEDVLQSELERQNWAEISGRGFAHMGIYGQWLLLSRWKQSFEQTTRYPVEGAARCPECGTMVANTDLTEDQAKGLAPGTYQDETKYDAPGKVKPKMTMTHCPMCQDHAGTEQQPVMDEMGGPVMDPVTGQPSTTEVEARVPGPPALEPFTPIGDEMEGTDHFGQEMGEDIPDGEWEVTTVWPDQVFPENMGIDVTNLTIRGFTIVEVHQLEWFATHFANGHKVKAEDPQEIMRYHPIAGERQIFFANRAIISGDGLFKNACRLRSSYIKPWREPKLDAAGKPILDRKGNPLMQMNHGRALLMAGNTVLFDGDYEIESQANPGKWIPRVHLENMVHEERSGGREYFGVSLAERLFDVQENINMIFSQIQDAREASGSPKWLIPKGMNFDYNSNSTAGAHWFWDADPGLPEAFAPREIGNTLLNPQVYTELESNKSYIDTATNSGPIDKGSVPGGVAAALAIQMLAEQNNEQRRPRIKRVREGLERVFSHGLALNHELVREPRAIWKSAEIGEWQKTSWTGTDLEGQVDVKIKAEPEHDTKIQKQQLVRDMIDAGLFDLGDARTRRIVAREMGGSSELFKQQDVQEDSAEREYIEYRDGGSAPVIEDGLDDNQMHLDRHTYDAQQEWARDKAKECNWVGILPMISAWNKPGPPVPQPQYFQNPDGSTSGVMVPTPSPSPLERFMALYGYMEVNLLEFRIMGTWKMMLMEQQQQGRYAPDPASAEALEWVMRFRAHIAAHKIKAELERSEVAAGEQKMAPTGAPSTAAGTIVAPGSAPGPGSIGVPQGNVGGDPMTTVPGSTMPVPRQATAPVSVGAAG